ncbi:MAG: NlpC/P60 family protein [Desulfomonilia bacterium]|jgi:cell wall-associated NlpC family hydrolase
MGSSLTRPIASALFMLLLLAGCSRHAVVHQVSPDPFTARSMGYSIQAGAFSQVENAARLTRALEERGIDAFYFPHGSGLFKVRFGNYASRSEAEAAARRLLDTGIIDAYLIVGPWEYVSARGARNRSVSIRDDLAQTAQSFIGIPYRWGSSIPEKGLDCSGLVLAVYELNGLSLPRTSREQFVAGKPIHRERLERGDLVFFATGARHRVSHVGIYIGNDRFIHAPATGSTIRAESLSSGYFQERYLGARTYLP